VRKPKELPVKQGASLLPFRLRGQDKGGRTPRADPVGALPCWNSSGTHLELTAGARTRTAFVPSAADARPTPSRKMTKTGREQGALLHATPHRSREQGRCGPSRYAQRRPASEQGNYLLLTRAASAPSQAGVVPPALFPDASSTVRLSRMAPSYFVRAKSTLIIRWPILLAFILSRAALASFSCSKVTKP